MTTRDADRLTTALRARGANVQRTGPERITVHDLTAEVISSTAVAAGALIVDLRTDGTDLETIFEELIHPKEYVS